MQDDIIPMRRSNSGVYRERSPDILLNVEHQPLEILSFGVVDIHWVIRCLSKAVEDPNLPPGLQSSSKYCFLKFLRTNHL